MEVVGDFKTADPIFKGSYGDSLLYSEDDLAQLRWQKVYLPTFQEEIPMPPPHPTNKVGNQQQPSNPHAGWQLQTCPWSPPRLDIPAARVGLHGAQDAAPIPLLRSALIPHPPRNPLIPRNQPQTAKQSPHRPAVPGSAAAHLLLLQGQLKANKGVSVG